MGKKVIPPNATQLEIIGGVSIQPVAAALTATAKVTGGAWCVYLGVELVASPTTSPDEIIEEYQRAIMPPSWAEKR
jgi:hypothetical protein